MATRILTQERLKELFHYNPETGTFTRLVRTANAIKVGDIAGGTDSRGYVSISINSKPMLAHRLAWLYVYGEFPKTEIDHINEVKSDNRIINLRDVTRAQNLHNQHIAHRHNRQGLMGVGRIKEKFVAHIGMDGKKIHLGTFSTAEEAHQAYLVAKRQMHSGCTI